MRDFKRLVTDPPAGICATPEEDDILSWHGVIFGPEDTPWEGGTFKVTLQFSEEYPNKAPVVKFVSRMFHPNSLSFFSFASLICTSLFHHASKPFTTLITVYQNGSICLDILQNLWSPIYDVSGILTSIQSLLSDPNPASPANGEAARLYTENKREYARRVREVVEQSWKDDE